MTNYRPEFTDIPGDNPGECVFICGFIKNIHDCTAGWSGFATAAAAAAAAPAPRTEAENRSREQSNGSLPNPPFIWHLHEIGDLN